MRIYVQNFIVQAEPKPDANGLAGYDIYYPDGRTHWMPAGDFEVHHRAMDRREEMLIDMNTQELQVLAISDKDYLGEPECDHDWQRDEDRDRVYCATCGADGDG